MSASTRRVASVPNCAANVHKPVCCRNLALLVDDAACGAAPELHAGRTLEHFHLVVVKAVAVVAAEVANAVQKYVVARSKSPDGEIIPLRPAFSRSNTYSWYVTNGVGESTILLIMQNKIRDHSHRLRCVQQVLGEFSYRDGRRQLCRHINGVGVLKPNRGIVRVLEGAVEASALQQFTESAVRRVEPLQTRQCERWPADLRESQP